MRVYMAGGSPIVETSLKNPSIMVSAFVDVKKGKPNTRLAKLMSLRRAAKKGSKKCR